MFVCNLIIKLLQTLILGEGRRGETQPVIPQTLLWPDTGNVPEGDQSSPPSIYNHPLNLTGVAFVCSLVSKQIGH